VQESAGFERFPLWIVVLSNLVSLSIYALGATILTGLAPWLSILYVLYCLWLEIRVLQKSCADCYYYGKVCGFGKGKLCALLFKQGSPQRFVEKQVSWADVLPDFGVSVFPLIGGIVRLIVGFSWPVVIAMGRGKHHLCRSFWLTLSCLTAAEVKHVQRLIEAQDEILRERAAD